MTSPTPSDELEQLLHRLRAAGVSQREIARARAEGRLPTLAVDHALGGGARHTLTALGRQADVDRDFLRRLLQAAGRPLPAPRERAFTDEDVELARLVKRVRDAGVPDAGILELARVVGPALQHSAEAVRRIVGDAMLRPGDSDEAVALRFVAAADALEPLAAPILTAIFKGHLRDGVRNALITEAERRAGRLAGTAEVAVAFADMVDYTKLGERLPPEDLGEVAGRLHELALASLCRPTQLVKTIGDAAMFVSPEVPPLIRTACTLLDAVRAEGEQFPDLRVGMAYGPATPRGGDWFGSPVNLASRVTDIARPGRVLATPELTSRAGDEFTWSPLRLKRKLRGVDGRVRLFALEPEAPAAGRS